MRGGVISRDLIALIPHYQESPLVQKAITDLDALLSSQQEQDHSAEKPAQREAGERQSVLQALRTRQAKQKAQEKSGEPKKAHTHKKGEQEL